MKSNRAARPTTTRAGQPPRLAPAWSRQSHAQPDDRQLRWSKRRRIQRHLRWMGRLVRMGPEEVMVRVQGVLERRFPALRSKSRDATGAVHGPELAAWRGALDTGLAGYLRAQFDTRFFFGPSARDKLRHCLSLRYPDSCREVIALADAVTAEGIELLGVRHRVVPGEIDWQADPQTGRRRWPAGLLDEASAIGVADADVKYVWELNRHQFLPLLGRAYWLTGDVQYVKRIVDIVDDWIAANPPGSGVNWCSHLEVGVRAMSWLWTLPFVLSYSDVEESFLARWVQCLAAHHRHLAAHLSIYTDPTNHLIGEATALWMLSVCLPDLPDAKREADRTRALLQREFTRQIHADGVNFEQASSYHRFVLDFYLQIYILAARGAAPDWCGQMAPRLQAMFAFICALGGDAGRAPMIGDCDDARGIPLLELVGWDVRDSIFLGGVLFDRQDWIGRGAGRGAPSVWLLGPRSAAAAFGTLDPEPEGSAFFPHGGYCFMRAGLTDARAELLLDTGPFGLLPNAAHAHADALNVIVRVNGIEMLCDPGTGAYFEDQAGRDAMRRTSMHNTVSVDGFDQADIFGPFKWVNTLRTAVRVCELGEDFDFVRASHDGYARLRDAVEHERTILFVKTDTWIIVDRLRARGIHDYTRHFSIAPEIQLTRLDGQTVEVADEASGAGIEMSFPELHPDYEFGLETSESCWSSRYGEWRKAQRLSLTTRGSGGALLFTIIRTRFPDRALSPVRCSLHRVDSGAVLCRVAHADGREDWICVNPGNDAMPPELGVQGRGEFAFLRNGRDGATERAFVAGKGAWISGPDLALGCKADRSTAGVVRRRDRPILVIAK